MQRIGYRNALRAVALSIAMLLVSGADDPPAALRRGINITNWFRFPPSKEPAALRSYVSDEALEELKRAGFTFLRLPVQPELLAARDALGDAIARIQRHGLAVIVSLFASDWHLETEPDDRRKLLAFWRSLAPTLRRFEPAVTFPELLNEPVFANDPVGWARLQHQALTTIRTVLPEHTVILTGPDWGSVSGLLSLVPEPDANVLYSLHFYEPAELTALGAYDGRIEQAAMARLPFPATDETACAATGAMAAIRTAELIRFYCAQRWDGARITARLGEAASWARRNHVRVIAGEFGASQRLNAAARLAWLATVRTACEHESMGWALWGYDDSMGFGVHPPPGPVPLDPAVLGALGLTK